MPKASVIAASLIFLAITLSLIPTVGAQYAYDIGERYALVDGYQFHQTDGIRVQQVLGFTGGFPIGKKGLVYEWYRPIGSVVRFRDRVNKDRVASTTLVMGVTMAIPAWTMMALRVDEKKIERILMPLMIPFGSHLGYRPTRWCTVYGGVLPDFMLFTEDDGLLVQARAGARLDIGMGVIGTIGYTKPYFWSFQSDSRTYEGGLYFGVSYSRPTGGRIGY